MERFLWICLAGAAGTGTRYLISVWLVQRFGAVIPNATLLINLVGCFVMSAVMDVAMAHAWSTTLRSVVTIGFLGGLTTYSSFNYETSRLFEDGARGVAILNATLTVAGGFVAGVLGMLCARQWLGR